MGQISRLYGYAILIAGVTAVAILGFSSLSLTRWDDEEAVPRADVGLVSVFLKLWLGVAVSQEDNLTTIRVCADVG